MSDQKYFDRKFWIVATVFIAFLILISRCDGQEAEKPSDPPVAAAADAKDPTKEPVLSDNLNNILNALEDVPLGKQAVIIQEDGKLKAIPTEGSAEPPEEKKVLRPSKDQVEEAKEEAYTFTDSDSGSKVTAIPHGNAEVVVEPETEESKEEENKMPMWLICILVIVSILLLIAIPVIVALLCLMRPRRNPYDSPDVQRELDRLLKREE